MSEAAQAIARPRFSWREFWRARGRDVLTLGGFFGAVFQREVRAQGRRSSTYVFRCLYALVIGAALSIMFAVTYVSMRETESPAEHVQSLQQIAPIMTLVIGWIAFGGLPLLGVIFAGPSVSEERRRGSLAELLTTPLTAREIILGKVGAVFVQLGVFALVPVPVLLASRVFGGVDLRVLLAAGLVVTGVSMMAVTLTVLASVLTRRASASIASGIVFVLVGTMGIALVYSLVCASLRINPNPSVIAAMCPPVVMAFLTAELAGGGGIPVDPVAAAGASLLYCAALSALAVVLATLLLRRLMRVVGASGAGPALASDKRARTGRSPQAEAVQAAASDGANPNAIPNAAESAPGAKPRTVIPRNDRDAREVGDNPVLWRETRRGLFMRPWHGWASAGAVALILLWVYWQAGLLNEVVQFPVAIIGTIIVLLIAATTTAGSISGERESKTWPALVTTPLSPAQILMGKYFGALRKQWPTPAIITLHALLTLLAGVYVLTTNSDIFGGQLIGSSWSQRGVPMSRLIAMPALLLATMIGPMALLTATGTVLSLTFRKSSAATTANVFIAIGLWIVVPILAAILSDTAVEERLLGGGYARLISDGTLALNPVYMTGATIDGCLQDGRFSLGRTSVTGTEFMLAAFGVLVFYLAAAWGVLRLGVAAFHRFSDRSS
ncbi:MAG: ABC transporter permease subunit [Planctomycetota bacterium]|nr:ABC transporter permease subunit [Planctomycetota bacterium]